MRWDPDGPQWKALAHPDEPYSFGGSAHNNPDGITFTAALARRWWDAWFVAPVDLADVNPGLLPGNLVLSPAEFERVPLVGQGRVLPKAPHDYNPLGLPVVR